ncbi:hypothetical protein CRV24_001299 [Beauveria bassiana]|nr:hypothetical protein CRV24_001299 [Beauveria bassiana]
MAANGLAADGSSAATDADASAANNNHDTNSTPDASRQHSTLPPHYNSFPRYHHTIHQPGPPPHASSSSNSSSGKQIPAATARVLGPDLLRGLLMAFMAMDHLGIALRPWPHGLGNGPERDGEPVTRWNRPAAYIVRSLTHLCAPGFALLLSMGVAYLGRARRHGKGWSARRLLRYFALRMAVLTLVMIAQSLAMTAGQVWFLNIVLFALAVDYFLAGAVWLALDETEHRLTDLLTRKMLLLRQQHEEQDAAAAAAADNEADAEQQPLLLLAARQQGGPQVSTAETKAARISWHVHNTLLLLLSVVTIFWNIWLSRDQGQCAVPGASDTAHVVVVGAPGGWPESEPDRYWWLHLWFWETSAPGVLSAFPPLAWLSFALVGVLYGRAMTIRDNNHPQRSTPRRLLGHLLAGLVFAVLFVLTRLLHIGNLSEHCLQTPENRAHPSRNQYLASPAAFFYTVKYPPDVAFWALTLAANFFLLAGLGRIPAAFAKRWLVVLLDFGTASLFFYVVHMPVVFLTGWAMCAVFGHETDQEEGPPGVFVSVKSIDNVFGVFAVWTLCMLIMWPLCRWYGRFKFGKPADSLWRMF